MLRSRLPWHGAVALMLSLALVACGDDDDTEGGDAGAGGSSGAGSGGKAGSGGAGGDGAGAGGRDILDAGGRVIEIAPERFFPEGVTVDRNGNFYIGSMDLGSIHRATANDPESTPFIEPDATNELVSVIGLYADDARDTLWVCSSDAGNASRAGTAPAAIKAFDLTTGDFLASYDWPAPTGDALPESATGGITGFCNDITIDAAGNLYATDSWYPRIVRLPASGDEIEVWLTSDVFPQDQWHLNGIDVDQSNDVLYVVENHPGALYAIPIEADGSPGTVTPITTSPRALLSPDGLKVAAPNVLVTAEGANDGGGVSVLRVNGAQAELQEVIRGFDQVATLALHQASAWVVENQGDHFWGPDDNGPDADPPFRLVEVPLDIGGGAGTIEASPARFFPEGVALDADDNFYIGSMDLGVIHRAAATASETEPFIEPDATNQLVSVLGLYADGGTLWVCSSDAGNGQLAGSAPAALKSFDIETGDLLGSWAWPAASEPLPESATQGVTGFCNDITVDVDGNVYATDSWYPRILRLPAGATASDELEEWLSSDVFPQDQWHLNGIDIDRANSVVYVVENHPGALYAIPILTDGSAGVVSAIETSRPLLSPDGLKVIGDRRLAVAEGQHGGMATIEIDGSSGFVRRISTGLDGIATFAMRGDSAWLVENQGDHFWGADVNGPDASKPFRLVEIPLNSP